MTTVHEKLHKHETLIGDGALGTLLIQRGLQLGQCPEAWNLTRPEVLTEVARLYAEAGSELLQTNTFGASPLKLASFGMDKEAERINARAVEIVREVAGNQHLVLASCGPSGKILKPYGDTDPEEVYRSFARQMKALVEAGADLICIETMTDLQEAVLAVKAVRDISGTIPVLATMTFDSTPKGFFTMMGNRVPVVARDLEKAGATMIGSNCGNGIEKMVAIAREFAAHTTLPLVIQANAGLPVIREGQATYPESPAFMAEKARELLDLNLGVLGGCCGTTPDHIRAFRRLLG